LKSTASSDLFLTFADTTALLRSWTVPTLFLGTSWDTAATLVPPSATSSARQATTMAGDGLRIDRRITSPFVFADGVAANRVLSYNSSNSS
jgi:hypothetical protein